MQETQVRSLDQEDLLEKEMETHSGILAGKSHGQRSLVGYSPSGSKESDTTEQLSTHTCKHIDTLRYIVLASLVAQGLKRLPTMQETCVRSLGREDPLEKELATHSSILAWRIPWMEEPGGLQSTGLQRVGHD